MNISFWWIEAGRKMSAGHEHSAITTWEAFEMKIIPGDWYSINLTLPPRASPSHSPCTVLYLFQCFPLAVQVFRILCKKFWHMTPVRLSEARREDCRCTQGWQCLNSTASKVEICTRNSRRCKQFCLGPWIDRTFVLFIIDRTFVLSIIDRTSIAFSLE